VITPEEIAEQAADAFQLGSVVASPVAVDEAWSNQVFRIFTSSGQYAIKLLTGASREALRTGTVVETANRRPGRCAREHPSATLQRASQS
jgi:hypothetical protein